MYLCFNELTVNKESNILNLLHELIRIIRIDNLNIRFPVSLKRLIFQGV